MALTALTSVINAPHRFIVSLFRATLAWQAVTSATFSPSSQSSPHVPLITRLALSIVFAIFSPPYAARVAMAWNATWKSSMASTSRPPHRMNTQLPV